MNEKTEATIKVGIYAAEDQIRCGGGSAIFDQFCKTSLTTKGQKIMNRIDAGMSDEHIADIVRKAVAAGY